MAHTGATASGRQGLEGVSPGREDEREDRGGPAEDPRGGLPDPPTSFERRREDFLEGLGISPFGLDILNLGTGFLTGGTQDFNIRDGQPVLDRNFDPSVAFNAAFGGTPVGSGAVQSLQGALASIIGGAALGGVGVGPFTVGGLGKQTVGSLTREDILALNAERVEERRDRTGRQIATEGSKRTQARRAERQGPREEDITAQVIELLLNRSRQRGF